MAVELAPRIVVDPEVRFGKPIIAGTRVPVDLVLVKISGGMSVAEIAAEYELTREDVYAAVAYAASVIGGEEIRLVA